MRLVSRVPARRSFISLTPLIDVVFILLIFFMLASSFMDWRSVDLSTAGKATASSAPEAALRLRVGGDGRVRMDGRWMGNEEARRALSSLAAREPDHRIAVEPEPGVPLQPVIDVLDLVTASGLTSVSLVRAEEG